MPALTHLQEGDRAPAFSLPASTGEKVKLSDLKGSPVVLYFYPKDATPGCTTEAQEFQKQLKAFEKAGAHVYGISADGVESHCKFVDKLKLAFPLLADESHAVCEKYGVWVEKNMYGKKFMGIQRATFLVGADGKLAKVWPKVSPKGHAKEVLDTVRAL
jgi:thioredoxin-dependent peroxiredoxin